MLSPRAPCALVLVAPLPSRGRRRPVLPCRLVALLLLVSSVPTLAREFRVHDDRSGAIVPGDVRFRSETFGSLIGTSGNQGDGTVGNTAGVLVCTNSNTIRDNVCRSACDWLEGTLNSTNAGYGIQVHSSSEPDNQSHNEGQTHLLLSGFGDLAVIGNASSGQNGNTGFRPEPIALSEDSPANRCFARTGIDAAGNTSKFLTNGFHDAASNGCPTS